MFQKTNVSVSRQTAPTITLRMHQLDLSQLGILTYGPYIEPHG